MAPQINELLDLSKKEKIDIIQLLWKSIKSDLKNDELPNALKQELDNRYEKYIKDPDSAITWDEAFKKIKTSLF